MSRYEPNMRLRAARQVMRLSQDNFALRLAEHMRDVLGIGAAPSGNLIGMWERGETRPRFDYRRGLMSLTGRTEADLGLVEDSPTAPPSGQASDTSRRELLLTASSTVGLALTGLPLPRLLGPVDRPTQETIADLRRAADLHRDWLYEHGASPELQHGIAHLLERTSRLLTHVGNSRLRTDLLTVVADISGIAAYAARDLAWHPVADQHYALGVQAAQAAGDSRLAGHLVVRMAGHAVERRQPDQILAYLERADEIGSFSHRQLSNNCALAAWAHAMRGDTQDALRLVRGAEDEYAADNGSDTSAWQSRHVLESELYSLTGAAMAALAQNQPSHAGEAIDRLSRSLLLRGGGYSRNRILDELSLAEAYLAIGETGHAAEAARDAMTTSRRVGSSRLATTRLFEVADKLAVHCTDRTVRDTVELIRRRDNSRDA